MRSRNAEKNLWGMEMVERKRGNHEISKCLNITYLERVLMLLHIKIWRPVQMQIFRVWVGEQHLLTGAWKKTLALSAPQFKLGCLNLPDYQEHCDGMNRSSTVWCHTSSISLHLWWHGVKDSIISRKHSPPACLNERSALGLEILEALVPW